MRAILIACFVWLFYASSAGAQGSIPPVVQAAINESRKTCNPDKAHFGRQFIDRKDVNGDGVVDYVLHYGQVSCGTRSSTTFCGTGGCFTQVFASLPNGRYANVLNDTVRHVQFDRVGGRPAMSLKLHGSACGKPGFEECNSTLFWDGQTFSPATADVSGDFDVCRKQSRLSPDVSIAACSRMISAISSWDARRPIAFGNRGLAYLTKQEWDRAISDFDTAARTGSQYEFVFALRGVAWNAKGDFDRAIADYDQALRLNPLLVERAEILYNRAIAYAKKGHLERAIADYDDVIKLQPGNVQSHTNRGIVFEQQGKLDLARADFQAALARTLTDNAPPLEREAQTIARARLASISARQQQASAKAADAMRPTVSPPTHSQLPTPADPASEATRQTPRSTECQPIVHQNWVGDCSHAFTFVNERIAPDAETTKLMLISDRESVRVVAVMSLPHYRRFFTNAPPVVARIAGIPHVVDGLLFCGSRSPILRINGKETILERDPRSQGREPLERNGNSQFRVPADLTERVTRELHSVAHAELVYCHSGHGQGYRAVFDLAGYRDAVGMLGTSQ